MTGFFAVVVHLSLPIKGVAFIMGNDLAGGKMYFLPVPIAEHSSDEPVLHQFKPGNQVLVLSMVTGSGERSLVIIMALW